MLHWASRFTAESLACPKPYPSMLKISGNLHTRRSWLVTSYSPLLSMQIMSKFATAERRLHRALSYYMLRCSFQFSYIVNVLSDLIEVGLHLNDITCDVLPLEPMYLESMTIIGDFPNERHFPAKIRLRVGAENEWAVHSVSLSRSSPNPYEATFRPPKNAGFTLATSTVRMKQNWAFEESVVNFSDAQMDWTLYDSTTRKTVFSCEPPKFSVLVPKTWPISRYFKARRAFTEEGEAAFAKDVYSNPIIWRLSKSLEGQTLKWIVQGSIFLTYWPNTLGTRFSETRCHDFREEVDLPLLPSSSFTPN
ncbi:uncharacterized protein LOC131070513 [Cryptomeria japonica]|uniref:uncharacterized protein LOC131070513 n=1 Tax=Cryptomeria japonica TaxID=3369 RepID=UPI0025AC7CCA|nr:uncharacterized protein LOC131070513 [Cryptomeria japonica]XP_057862062.1 uncharacterized protein LOC131070513 [Cryptomeria japonica]XP_057862063.1 uncharacterized protein LOC131070513 [Cryptomeria japonica]